MAWRMAVEGKKGEGRCEREQPFFPSRLAAAGALAFCLSLSPSLSARRPPAHPHPMLTVNLGHAATALAPDPDVHDAEALLAQEEQGLLHLGAQGGGLDEVDGRACVTV
jgi:hypothetical protein